MSRLTTDFDAIFAASPLDATAASVVSETVPEYHYTPQIAEHWKDPPKTEPWYENPQIKRGHRCGRLSVVGVLSRGGTSGTRWLVRCTCGSYEPRRTRSLLNPQNTDDKCCECRRLDTLKKRDQFMRTKRGQDWAAANLKPLMGDAKP